MATSNKWYYLTVVAVWFSGDECLVSNVIGYLYDDTFSIYSYSVFCTWFTYYYEVSVCTTERIDDENYVIETF
jgi:hypothetical protein